MCDRMSLAETRHWQGRRTPVSNRLESLLSSSAWTSPDEDATDAAMHRTRSTTRLWPRATTSTKSSGTSPTRMSPDQQPKSPTPVLRWLGDWSNSPLHTRPQSGSSPPNLSLLDEALHEPLLPTFPPVARLPDSFYASRNILRPPPFLDNLSRSTLPTSSLSPPHTVSTPLHPPLNQNTFIDPLESPPIVLNQSPPTLSSLDTLRSVSVRDHDRSMHTTATQAVMPDQSATPVNWWWFQSENKDNVDTLLTEDDRADTVQQEQDNIRNKCLFLNPLLLP